VLAFSKVACSASSGCVCRRTSGGSGRHQTWLAGKYHEISNIQFIYIYIQILWMIFPIKDFEISHIPLVIPLMGDFPSDLHLEGGFPI
jgi:hypothetical protein